jgi:hypothetical protein
MALSRKERLERKRECERRRRARIRKSQSLVDEQNRKRREKYAENEKIRKDRKKNMTKRENRYQRQKWRNAQRRKRERDRDALNCTAVETSDKVPHQVTSGQKRKAKNLAKCYYDKKKLLKKNEKLQKRLHRYESQVSRLKVKLTSVNDKMLKLSISPQSKLNRDLKGENSLSPDVKRRLLLGEAVLHDLKNLWRKMKSRKKKRKLVDCIQFQYIKKYRFMSSAKPFFPIKLYPHSPRKNVGVKKNAFNSVRKTVWKFFLRDDVSSVAPGKKDCTYNQKEGKETKAVYE